jgi:type II secretory pathway component PulF
MPSNNHESSRLQHERAHHSATFTLSLAELLRAGAKTPRALTAMAARHRDQNTPHAPVINRIATAVREQGLSLAQAIKQERQHFTPRFLAAITLANLGGQLFKTFVDRLHQSVQLFLDAPPDSQPDFPIFRNEPSEFCFLFGHLIVERASQPDIQQWLPKVFSQQLRLPATHLLARFFDQGILLSNAFSKTPPFHDPEMILAVRVGEEINQVGRELISLSRWIVEREQLEERLRMIDWILPPAPPAELPRE